MKKYYNKNTYGITLISLVITIIVLLILAGITINLTIGQEGILKQTEEAGVEHNEKQAKERLELVLSELEINKFTDNTYNENEYINKRLDENNMKIDNDIVIVDGWQFVIDRKVPVIIDSLGKGEFQSEIQIAFNNTIGADYSNATLIAEIVYNGEIKKVTINGENIEVPEKQEDGKYVIEKEISNNGNYIIKVENEFGEYNIATMLINSITEDMEINTVDDIIAFRNKVNEGRTFKGKTVSLKQDIDLSSVCSEDIGTWVPIGDYSISTNNIFNGTFEGNNHTISNMYIDSTNERQGLFGTSSGTIQNVILKDANIIKAGSYCGILIGVNSGSISNIQVTGKIQNSGYYTGGIAGYNSGTIKESINFAIVNSNRDSTGGICGANNNIIEKCVNKGDVSTTGCVCGGIVGSNNEITPIVRYCYNLANIKATGKTSAGYTNVGGIAGYNRGALSYTYSSGQVTSATNNGYGLLIGQQFSGASSKYSYATPYNSRNIIGYKKGGSETGNAIVDGSTITGWDQATIVTKLTDNFIKDENNINGGYPILKWQGENQ